MYAFQHGIRRTAVTRAARLHIPPQRQYASRIELPFQPPPFPVIDSCPSPTCQCRETPPGLDIEREQSLNGSMAAYAEQVLISTGQSDWKSKIEDEEDGVLLRQMKRLLGRGGKYSNPYHNVLLTNTSFAPTPPTSSPTPTANTDHTTPPASAFLLPSFTYIPSIPTSLHSIETFLKAFILPSSLHHGLPSPTQQNHPLRQPSLQKHFPNARKINEILVLICGHGGRDARCGTLGPILKAEFEEKLQRQNVALLSEPPVLEAVEVNPELRGYVPTARVGLISHIGGHKFAGNVIIYIPPSFQGNALAGKGVWYGRVGPEHVEGIVAKTVLGGKVIKDMFRGGIEQGGGLLRL